MATLSCGLDHVAHAGRTCYFAHIITFPRTTLSVRVLQQVQLEVDAVAVEITSRVEVVSVHI
jgi:hypothetical protein